MKTYFIYFFPDHRSHSSIIKRLAVQQYEHTHTHRKRERGGGGRRRGRNVLSAYLRFGKPPRVTDTGQACRDIPSRQLSCATLGGAFLPCARCHLPPARGDWLPFRTPVAIRAHCSVYSCVHSETHSHYASCRVLNSGRKIVHILRSLTTSATVTYNIPTLLASCASR